MLFDYITKDMTIFKAMDIEYNDNFQNPSWFTSSSEVGAYAMQSKFIHMVRLQTGIKLINISSKIFHDDLMNKILINISDQQAIDMLLLPLGLPDIDYQKKIMENMSQSTTDSKLKLYLEECLKKTSTNDRIKLFGNHHRFSLDKTDTSLISFIRYMYPEYHGIITPVNWPSCFHNEDFPMEICIFNPSLHCKLIKTVQKGGGRRKQKAGTVIDVRHGYYRTNKYDQIEEDYACEDYDILKKFLGNENFDFTFKDMVFKQNVDDLSIPEGYRIV